MKNKLVKIRFEFYNDILDRQDVETLWSEVVDAEKGYYKIDNIPFFVKNFASADIVKAIKNDEGFPKVTDLIEASGNSTINIIFFNKEDEDYKQQILNRLEDFGLEYEGMENVIKGYYALHIPKEKNYETITNFLDGEKDGLDYREACIGH